MVQNSPYYVKTFRGRFQPGIRIECEVGRMLFCITHDDYDLVMRCMFWNTSYGDGDGELGHLFKSSFPMSEVLSEPIYFGVTAPRAMVCLMENNLPLNVILVHEARLEGFAHEDNYNASAKLKNFLGTAIFQTEDPGVSVERGLFNSFRYVKKHATS
jgi:hypothetical protein